MKIPTHPYVSAEDINNAAADLTPLDRAVRQQLDRAIMRRADVDGRLNINDFARAVEVRRFFPEQFTTL